MASFKVKRHLIEGELSGEAKNSNQIIEELNGLLNDACTWDIVGPVLIEDTKGNFYTIRVEARIVKIEKAEADEMLENEDLAQV